MGAVNISIGHNNNFAITQLVNFKLFANIGSERNDQ